MRFIGIILFIAFLAVLSFVGLAKASGIGIPEGRLWSTCPEEFARLVVFTFAAQGPDVGNNLWGAANTSGYCDARWATMTPRRVIYRAGEGRVVVVADLNDNKEYFAIMFEPVTGEPIQ